MTSRKVRLVRCLHVLLAGFPIGAALAHGPAEERVLEWKNDQIRQVVAPGRSGRKVVLEGRECLAGKLLDFDVRDDYAFDIDETVWLDLEFRAEPTGSAISVDYDRNAESGGANHVIQIAGRADARWFKQSIPLEHARFANLKHANSDLVLAGSLNAYGVPTREFTLCGLSLRRTYATAAPKAFGRISIEVLDENGRSTPVRMGIYQPSGGLVLPGDQAIFLQNGSRRNRVIGLGAGLPPWPVKTRFVFYAAGHYEARLPVGEYELIVAKGPEYRLNRQPVVIEADATRTIKIQLKRWVDMAQRGWYSGDDHIHYLRQTDEDDRNVLLFAQGEDLKVANILQMGNSAEVTYTQRGWVPVKAEREPSFVLVPGQEDPRTGRRGHAIGLNIKEPVRDPARYLLYHEVFEKVRQQGGLAGYAHVIDALGAPNISRRGMAMDVPFGVVDFAEILSLHYVGVSIWFDFLNLGYKLPPSAGTDYPANVPGTVRSYVEVKSPFTAQAWFDGLKEGRTFVTSGPMLELSLNGQGMGSEIHVTSGAALRITGKASLNPDIDGLASLELVERGETVRAMSSDRGLPQMELQYEVSARHGTWFLLRARGKDSNVVALSGPIYVFVDGEGFWKPVQVPAIVARLKSKMQEVLIASRFDDESWEGSEETRAANEKYWESQQAALRERIERANAIYDDLARRAAASGDR